MAVILPLFVPSLCLPFHNHNNSFCKTMYLVMNELDFVEIPAKFQLILLYLNLF